MTAHSAYCPAQMVPAYDDLHRMAQVLLAQNMGAGTILVLGAGGGNEMAALAAARPDWRCVGVDPSLEMLDLARSKCAAFGDRITYVQGKIEDAPMGPFEGATCILTLHFLPKDERLATLRDMRARLKTGAALVVAHHCIPSGEAHLWLPRFADFAASNGVTGPGLANGAAALGKALPILTPDEDMALLRAAGFRDVAQFFHAFTFRGFMGTAQ
jgi:tRNA (cmo5U34)-methyltransferase